MKTQKSLVGRGMIRIDRLVMSVVAVLLWGACAPAFAQSSRVLEINPHDTPGVVTINGEIEAVYPIDHVGPLPERGFGPTPLHANLTTDVGVNFLNTGASGAGAAAITRLIAGNLFLTGPGTVNRLKFAIVNQGAGAVTARALVRFYQDTPPAGPGTFITGYNFNPITFAGNTVTIVFANVTPASLPATLWAGMSFDAGGAGPALATIAQLNQLGMRLFSPATAGDINGQMFRTTSAGGFVSNNPPGTQSSQLGTAGWELRNTVGACCFEARPCQQLEEAACLNGGGVFRGQNTPCAVCATALNFLHDPPQPGFFYALDQISCTDLADQAVLPRGSQQVNALPPSTLNVAYIDDFTILAPRVISRIDTLVTTGAGQTLPPQGGWLMSIWASPAAAVADPSLEGNTIYDQGYTVPLAVLGGGEYDLVSLIGAGNPLGAKGLATQTNPTIAFNNVGPPEEPDPRGITPSGANGLVLPAGTYYIAIMHRAPSSFQGFILDSTDQDPRATPNNGFRVNPGGGVFGGGIQQVNVPVTYRVMARFCRADFNGDGLVNTNDLVGFLTAFGTATSTGSPYDLNSDEVINVQDLTIFLARFGGPCQ
ncbi:MAG: GC-type dockerin domain-anchored protein [Phycisphaerales bacterium]